MTDEEPLANFDAARWLRLGHRRTKPIDKPGRAEFDAWINSEAGQRDLRVIGLEVRRTPEGLIGVALPHFQDADDRDDRNIAQLRAAWIADAPGIRMGIIKFLQHCGLVELKEVRGDYVCIEVTKHPANSVADRSRTRAVGRNQNERETIANTPPRHGRRVVVREPEL